MYKRNGIFSDLSRGASVTEVLLAMAIVTMAAPFVYNQIAQTNRDIRDISMARDIIALRDPALNFIRINQDSWPDAAQIQLSDDELDQISDTAFAGFIDKYSVKGAGITDVYLAFNTHDSQLHANRIARQIGDSAAVVDASGVAYGNTWAISAPDLKPGDLIYRISRDFSGNDKTKYLHRATSGDDNLNVMQRDLHMGGFNAYNIGTASAESARINSAVAMFVTSDDVSAENIYFSSGANMDGGNAAIGTMRVSGDITGFRNIYADNLNGGGYTTAGRIIADRARVNNSVNVAGDFVLKSDSARTISAFTGIRANSVYTTSITASEMVFYGNVGLTVSGELLMSTTPALKIGGWSFPSLTPPRFDELSLSRAAIPATPVADEFAPLMSSGWQDIPPITEVQ